jgi:hypothetical protein
MCLCNHGIKIVSILDYILYSYVFGPHWHKITGNLIFKSRKLPHVYFKIFWCPSRHSFFIVFLFSVYKIRPLFILGDLVGRLHPAGNSWQNRVGEGGVAHKVLTYKEYHSVCPSSELGLSQPLSRQRVFPSPQKQGGKGAP